MEVNDRNSHEEQRNRVIEMASQMFFEQGIRKVRMDDVAAALTMSKRTLYEMFADKEELLLECMKVNQEKKRENTARVADSANNVLEIVLRLYQYGMDEMKHVHPSMYRDIKKYPKVCEYLNQRKAQSTKNSRGFYETGVRQGLLRADINFDIFQFLVDLSMSGFLTNDLLMERWTLADVLDTVVRVNMRGICTEKGQRMLDEFLREK
jgi:AcrR family transcriptional regulator